MKSHQLHRFYLLTSGSTVVPGLGLIPTRRRLLGLGVLGVFVVALAALLLKFGTQGLLHTALSVGLDRTKLLEAMVAIVVGAVVWCAAIVATAITTQPLQISRVDRWATRLFTALCCVLVIIPSVFVGRTIAIQRDVIGTVFHAAQPRPGIANPDTRKADPWAGIQRVNLLLLGSDAGFDRVGTRTDSMMVASIDPQTGNAVLFGLPRNLEKVPFPTTDPLHTIWPHGFGPCPDANGVEQCLLNAVWTEASVNHPDLFRGVTNPGLVATRDAISAVLGLKIDYTTVIDLTGFQQLVDAMGGVDINVQQRVCVGCKGVNGTVVFPSGNPQYINPGYQHLNGYLSLWYARSRAESDDFSRMRRQRCVVGALVSQVNPVKMLTSYASLASVLKKNVSVDIPQGDLPAWVTLVERMKTAQIQSLPITDQVVNVANPDFDKIHALVQAAIHPVVRAPTPTTSTSPKSTPSATKTTPSATTTTQKDELTTLAASC